MPSDEPIGAIMPDGTRLDQWDERLRAAGARAIYPDADDFDGPPSKCTGECRNVPAGTQWAYTGTQYGGDDPSFHGEGRCYCIFCGEDGDA